MDHFITTLSKLMKDHELPGLLIGGHAVISLGHPRATFDVDFLIPSQAVKKWKNALKTLSFRVFADSGTFVQFESRADLPLPVIDLMVVDPDVYDQLKNERRETTVIPTPSAKAMIALKLHAIHQPAREDTDKDWSDIFAIIDAQKLSLDDSDFFSIVERHGGAKGLKKIQAHFTR